MDEQAKQARATCLRLLAATPKTRRELEKKLSEKGYPRPLIGSTLDELETQGLLSDAAYAKNLVSRLTHGKPSGRRKISFELKRRGVPVKIQEEVLSEITSDNELEKAKELALYKWEQGKRLDPMKRKKKVYDFLMRRGFDYQLVREVMQEMKIDDDEN
jgi:regulatory protein